MVKIVEEMLCVVFYDGFKCLELDSIIGMDLFFEVVNILKGRN